jgi:hypothetical protein
MRHDHYLRTALAITLALGAIAAPAASADGAHAGWVVRPNPDQQAPQLARAAAAAPPAQTSSVVRPNADQQTPVSAPTTIVRVSTPTSGFHWGDAGIGAAAGFALSMLALGLVLVASQRGARRSRRSAATTS